MTRKELIRAVVKAAWERAEESAHRLHFWLIVMGGVALIAFGIYLEHYWIAAVLPALALVALFLWGIFEQAYQMISKGEKAVEEANNARDAVLERLKPKLEILAKDEIDQVLQCCRIRVRSLCDVNLQFGAELKELLPDMPGAVLPFRLRITQQGNDWMGTLPARQTRTVDVIGVATPNDMCFLGVGGNAYVQRSPYRLVICAHCDEGPSVEQEFIVDVTGRIPGLRACVEEPTASPLRGP